MDRRHLRRAALVLAAAALAVAANTLPATATSPASSKGQVGAYYLTDTSTFPGARCRYNDAFTLTGMRVRPPVIYARSQGPARDSQTVGWQIIVQRHAHGTWSTVSSSAMVKGTAFDDQPASFSIRKVSAFHFEARALVKMTWFKAGANNVVDGTAKRFVRWYDDPFGPFPSCLAEHL